MSRGFLVKRGQSWSIVVELASDPETGRRRRKWFTAKGKTKKAAEAEMAALVSQVANGGLADPTRETVGAYMIRWLAAHAPSIAPRTRAGYATIIRAYIAPTIGAVPLQKLLPQHIQDAQSALLKRGLSTRTVIFMHRVLHRALADAVRWGMLTRNVCAAVSPPRLQRKPPAVLSPDGAQAILRAAQGSVWEVPVRVALSTGLRRGELLALGWENVGLEAARLRVVGALQRVDGRLTITEPKTARSRREIALSPELVDVLKRHRTAQLERRMANADTYTDRGFVFTNDLGGPLDPDAFTHGLKRIAGGGR
ncbi:MAG: site-specific integrase, partial [Chloroflexi bacterium]|nr:site-specific integrase [Chloroflexota bacterium]